MSISRAFHKMMMCSNEKTLKDEEKFQEGTPSSENGFGLKLGSSRDMNEQHHHTFPLVNPHQPHPSHFQTAPSSSTETHVESPSEMSPAVEMPQESRFSARSRTMRPKPRRKSTLELQENKLYHPRGGPDYLYLLAKYNLFGDGDGQPGARVICRFVRQGNARERRPQVIKIEQDVAESNQEFLAHVTIGDSEIPQGTLNCETFD